MNSKETTVVEDFSTAIDQLALTPRFLSVVKDLETAKEAYKKAQASLEEIMVQMEVGTMFQDPATKLVYKIVVPNGTFVAFKKIDYVRTKKVDEDKGSLSVKEAEAAGFTVK